MYGDELSYDMDGLLNKLRARCLLGILEHRARVYSLEVEVGAKSCIRKQSERSLSCLVRCLGNRGNCDAAYCVLINKLLQSCRTGRFTTRISAGAFSAVPGLGLAGGSFRVVDCYMERMPMSLATAPVHKGKCWHCKKTVDTLLQKCANCKRARFCGASCQLKMWGAHKLECKAIARYLSDDLMQGVRWSEVMKHDVWASFLRRHLRSIAGTRESVN